jgi:predicted DNA binding CopG/RHH family protein
MESKMDSATKQPIVRDLKWYANNQVLDEEEEQIAQDMAAGLYVPTKNLAKVKAEFKEAAQNMLKKKPITIRVQQMDLVRLKHIAIKTGIPYQTLVSSILHRYVTGQLKGEA